MLVVVAERVSAKTLESSEGVDTDVLATSVVDATFVEV